jgi:O-antigen/teichoic acid export membrane protein
MKLEHYAVSSLKEKILSGGFWAFTFKLITGFLGLLVNILLVRIMPLNDMGSYYLTHSMVTIFSLVAQFGLPQLIVRLVSENLTQNKANELKGNIYTIAIIGIFSCFVVGMLVIFYAGEWMSIYFFDDPKMITIINLAAFWMVALSFQQILVETYRGLHDIKMATLFGGVVVNTILVVIFSFMLYLDKSDYYMIVQVSTIAVIINVLISLYILSRRLRVLRKEKYEFKGASIVNDAWPLWLTTISVFVLTQSDLWIVSYFLHKTDVALYGSSLRLMMALSLIVSLSYAVLPPIISEMNKKGEFAKLQNVLRAFAFGNSLLVAPIFLIILLFPSYVLEVLFGESYIGASTVLILLSIGKLFNVVTGIRGYVLMLTGHGVIQMKISFFVGILNIVFCTIGAVEWGIIGVSIGAMSAMIIQCLLEMRAVKSKLGVWTHLSLVEFKNLVSEFKYK